MIDTEKGPDAGQEAASKMGSAEVLEALQTKHDLPVKKIELYPPTAAHDEAVAAARDRVQAAVDKPKTHDEAGYENLIKNAAAGGPVESDRLATPDEIRAAGVAPTAPEVGGATKMTPVAGPKYEVEAGPRHAGGTKGWRDRVSSGFRRMLGRSQPKH